MSLDEVRAQIGNPPWSDAVLAAKWQETLNYYNVDGRSPGTPRSGGLVVSRLNRHAPCFLGAGRLLALTVQLS
jgi:hypothetical protein